MIIFKDLKNLFYLYKMTYIILIIYQEYHIFMVVINLKIYNLFISENITTSGRLYETKMLHYSYKK